MNTKRNQKTGMWKRSSTIHYSLLTIHSALRRGISLMEVLASVFVIGIGLVGALAVIPFGAFQVSKANHADYCANMLRTAGAEIRVRNMANPLIWNSGVDDPLNCSLFIMFDPFAGAGNIDNPPTMCRAALPVVWQEVMRGQDDLMYTLEETDSRPTWTPSGSATPFSSGKYSWFFTFKPEPLDTWGGGLSSVPKNFVRPRVSVDVLACYNRSPGDPQKEQIVPIQTTSWNSLLSGATVTLDSWPPGLTLDGTKYIFVTWEMSAGSPVEGSWCRIVSRRFDLVTGNPTVTLVGPLPPTPPMGSAQAFIVDGVLYHTRIDNVRITDN